MVLTLFPFCCMCEPDEPGEVNPEASVGFPNSEASLAEKFEGT